MLKSFVLKVLRLVALTVLIAQVTFSTALAQETASPEATSNQSPEIVESPAAKLPEPNEPKAEESVATPSREGEKASVVSSADVTYPQPPSPYDIEAIAKFNDRMYGKGNW